jgi:hypothetical protein
MGGANFYLLSSLPTLGRLGDTPPLSEAELLERVAEGGGPRRLIEALLLSDDLLQREAYLAGEVEEVSPAVLTPEQARNDEPLPEHLSPGERPEGEAPYAGTDALWQRYFRWAAAVASQASSALLGAWVSYEVALRNALAAERARALDLEPQQYLVATDLADETADLDDLVSRWSSAGDPLAGLRVLDEARWAWLDSRDPRYSFADDELAAYAAKLMLLHRWHRLSTDEGRAAPAGERREPNTGVTP